MRSPKFTLAAGFLLLSAVFLVTQHASAGSLATVGTDNQLPVTVIDCPIQPSQGFPRFARLMHDPQWMPWPSRMGAPDWPSGFHYDWYPETVPLLGNPRGTKASVPYSREWLQYLRELQPSEGAAVWIARVAAGLFNNGNAFIPILELDQLQQDPVAAAVSSGGNLVNVLETKNGAARIEMLYFKAEPPDPAEVNYVKTPWLVTKFTSVSVDGKLGNAGGIDVYFPNLADKAEGYWVDLERMEFFPQLPLCATLIDTVSVVNTTQGLAKEVVTLEEGETIVIYEYLPEASNVWGRSDQGWILLEYLNSAGRPVFPTSWSMETRPPILFP